MIWFAFLALAVPYAHVAGGRAATWVLLAALVTGIAGAGLLAWRLRQELDFRLAGAAGVWRLKKLRVVRRTFPAYRFVDLIAAAEALTEAEGRKVLDANTEESLNDLLQVERPRWSSRRITRAPRREWAIGADAKELHPTDRFWVRPKPHRQIVRVGYCEEKSHVLVEVAAPDAEEARSLLNAIAQRSAEQSIYRGRVLEVGFREATRDEYGDVVEEGALVVVFPKVDQVGHSDIVLSETTMRTLRRNVIDVQRRGDVLHRFGVPVRRGVLLYGPPGTGKTFACRYVCSQLPGVTRIFVTGAGLAQIRAIMHLATLYSPALVILEDFDLVIPSREISGASGLLAELLDAMDGVRPNQDIGFLLTTNSLARIEAAIKDRPGRISQCVYMGPPNAELRRRYLERYLEPYDVSSLDLVALVRRSVGATHAFLKDWVHRAAQIALEESVPPDGRLDLPRRAFEEAFEEMSHREVVANQIVGFLGTEESTPES